MGPQALTPFILYRIVCGVGVGIASMLSPLYIAEIAPSQIRGRLVSFNQLSIVLGILLVYFVNWAIASQGDEAWVRTTGWRLMLVSEAVPALLFPGVADVGAGYAALVRDEGPQRQGAGGAEAPGRGERSAHDARGDRDLAGGAGAFDRRAACLPSAAW